LVLLGALVLAVIAVMNLAVTHFSVEHFAVWCSATVVVGLIAVWRGASPDERRQLELFVGEAPIVGANAKGWRSVVVRVVIALVLAFAGLRIMSRIGGLWGAAVPGLVALMALALCVLVVAAPWWMRTVRELSSERRERIYAEERARVAAHIHDGVLQALTLIERAAESPTEVRRLARSQERELRQWLFEPERTPEVTSFTSALADVQEQVERDYGIQIDIVTVGDAPLTDELRDLVAAGREAVVNAARWSGSGVVSIFGEIEEQQASLYVRDTGRGFDPDALAGDRRGIRVSIEERVRARGGRADVRSQIGQGTDVELVVPRTVNP
jgi:signal transduction histidine kinase